jgi:WD40-like Beta Propeller Repeat
MIDIDARGRHEAERLRKEAARIADTEAALQSVLAGEVVVPLEPHRRAPSRGPVARRRVSTRRRIRLVVGGLVAAGLVAVLALVVRNGGENQTAAGVPANGLIAFAGNPGDGSAQSDIYVVAPDGTRLRALTSTPELAEFAPSWSPDGSRLAFVRTNLPAIPHMRDCTPNCEFVVVDPTTGVETFSADVNDHGGRGWVPTGVAWSPDGRAIVVQSLACGSGGCTGGGSVIADLDTGAFTTFRGYEVMWSPDGEWLALVKGTDDVPGPALLLVPAADLIGAGDVVDIAELAGVRPLPGAGSVEWMPDGSAMLVSDFLPDRELIEHVGQGEAWIDVVTVSDGRRRRLIEDGFDPIVSPDGSQIAYSHERAPAGVTEIWVAAADGSDPRRVAVSSTPPAWSPDGSLLLASDADGWFTIRPDGTGRTQITPFMLPDANAGCCPDYRPSWQPLPPGSTAARDDGRAGFIGVPLEGTTSSTPNPGDS